MTAIAFAIPGDIDQPTGGYGYDRRLLAEWRKTGVRARHLPLPAAFPNPGEADLAETRRLLAAAGSDEVLLVDGLASGAFPEDLAREFGSRTVALVHHPLGFETGLTEERARALIAGETAMLRHVAAIVVTSPATARLLVAHFGVEEPRITVAVPGVDAAPRARGAPAGAPPHLVSVGSIIPRKAYDVLVAALATLADLPWTLSIVGGTEMAPQTAQALRTQIADAGLEHRIRLTGAVVGTALDAAYDAADIFVLPSVFEGYGMALTEAVARGLPVVCTTGAVAAETLAEAATVRVAPGDAAAFAAALAPLLRDPAERLRRADAAWAQAASLPRWDESARRVAQICAKVSR